MDNGFKETFLKTFLNISTWQSAVAILVFFLVLGGFWYGLRKIKIKFIYRILIGMLFGLIAGLAIQATIGFPGGAWFTRTSESIWANVDGSWIDISSYYVKGDDGKGVLVSSIVNSANFDAILAQINAKDIFADINLTQKAFTDATTISAELKSGILWITQFNGWVNMIKQIFINGVLLITVPIVFVAIFRITAKPKKSGLARISSKGITILLINVALAFTITFIMGYFLNIGKGLGFDDQIQTGWTGTDSKSLPGLISGYVPSNAILTLSTTAVIPVIVLAVLFGTASKYVRKKHPESMDKLLNFMDRTWDIIISILMMFMKFMPFAVMAMFTTAITTRPIGALTSVGWILLVGYVGLIIMLGIMTLIMFVSGINVKVWWKHGIRAFIQGFSTQSSNATLPTTIDATTNQMKIKEEVTGVIAPISTTLGLVGCAGVQGGLITSVLYTGSLQVQQANIFAFFIMALIATVIASIGIAGVPGTATVVTSAVLNGIGYGAFFAPVYAIFGAIDGLFDMGRTATNVTGGMFASTMVARQEGLFDDDTELINKKLLQNTQIKIKEKNDAKEKNLAGKQKIAAAKKQQLNEIREQKKQKKQQQKDRQK